MAATESEVCADGDSASGDLASVVQKNVHYEHYSTVPSQGTCGTYWNLDLVKKQQQQLIHTSLVWMSYFQMLRGIFFKLLFG